ncbi:MAG: translation initiation factor IF-2 [Hyphomicrobiaceae bacterium]
MTETKEPADKTGAAGRASKPGTLRMQKTESAGHVKQSFSHGRVKSVVVEKKTPRKLSMPAKPAVAEPPQPAPEAPPVQQQAPQPKPQAEAPRRAPPQSSTTRRAPAPADAQGLKLSDNERDARIRALNAAREREQVERRRAEEEAKARAEREAEQQRLDAEAKRVAEIEARKKAAEEAAAPAREAKAAPQPSAEAPARVSRAPGSTPARTGRPQPVEPAPEPKRGDEERRSPPKRVPERVEEESEEAASKRGPIGAKKAKPERSTPVKRTEERRGRLTITNAFDDEQRERSLASLRRKREREKIKLIGLNQNREKIQRDVVIPEAITIQELSNRMAERAVDIIKYLMKEGAMHQINDVIDADTAELIVQEFGHTPKRVAESDVEEGLIGGSDVDDDKEPRAPIVTIMGHVDHGKTSLLDALRKTNVVAGEAGGITQHIGAYQVTTEKGNKITFIDTPGHEAFTAMRARGAKVTDIVVLVVAADDGVMPQTIEAINHAKAAGVPLIVAINKMDKPSADPNRVRNELLRYEVVVESMSGEVLEVEVSALKGTNLDKLLDAIALQAELLELRANPNRSAEGVVVEAKLEAGRGPVGTVLIQRGTLRVGDIIVAGAAWGRVRALLDAHGAPVKEAGPSVPVEVLGFSSAPEAGDQLAVVENEGRAREITDYRVRKRRERTSVGAGSTRTLEQMMASLKGEGMREFPLLVKGDVQGSVEAITAALDKLGTEEVSARVVHAGVGGITESDISLAAASKAVVVGFNVRANAQARQAAEREGVEIRYYAIIYDLVDEVKKAMSGLLAPTMREVFLGNAEILEVFNITKVGKVAGCRVTDGKVERGAEVRLIRDNVVIHRGKLSTLKRFKDEVREVPVGQECGMAFENYQDIRQGDTIECFRVETVVRTL